MRNQSCDFVDCFVCNSADKKADRKSLGRTSAYFRFDMHADYPWRITENKKLEIVADFFNVFNSTKVRQPNQDFQLNGGVPNVDFLQPQLFDLPFNMRLGMRFEW